MSLPPFQALLDAHGAVVHRFLVAAVGPVDADDCFQETWIAALRAYDDLDHAENLRGWLLRIAQRKAIDSHRSAARRALPAERLPEPAAPPPEPVDGEPRLWARVRALPEKQRAAVFLRTVAGLPYAEVAVALDCSRDAARRNVHDGLQRLRKELIGA
ncbi:MAG: RNA polymerase sigma factor [Solirubrobacterales bacterium]|mgnify:CR=1 FL=1|nr:RNA polymerase sigma factor [Solirubrobacterales bacterium]